MPPTGILALLRSIMTLLLYWSQCDCHVWPLTPLYGVYKCGECGTVPHTPCDEPTDGKAHAL